MIISMLKPSLLIVLYVFGRTFTSLDGKLLDSISKIKVGIFYFDDKFDLGKL